MPRGAQEGTVARARRGRAPSLSRHAIASAALEIADRDGLDALTMQRVAGALGVGTMTLYGYFRSKDELLDAVVDAAVEDLEPLGAEGSWREQLHHLVHTAHDGLTRHPGLVQLRLRRPVLRPEALRFSEAALGILHGAGFDSAEAAQAFRLLFTYTFGFAGLSPERSAEEARRQAASAIAALPADEYPNLTSAASEASRAMAGEEQFEYGLERILDGLEARLGERALAPPPADAGARQPGEAADQGERQKDT
jgi:AcrR family transcriptional regulator